MTLVIIAIVYAVYAFNLGLNTANWSPLINAIIILSVVSIVWLVLIFLDK